MHVYRFANYLIAAALFVVCFDVNGTAQQAIVGTSDAIRFQRVNLVVTDIDRATEVYRGVLGLKLSAVRNLPVGGYAHEIFQIPPKAPLRFAVFSSDSQSNIVALTEVKNVSIKSTHAEMLRTGLVLETADFNGVISRANTMGLKVFSENEFIASGGRFGRQQAFVDYDGNVIVVYAFIDTQGQE